MCVCVGGGGGGLLYILMAKFSSYILLLLKHELEGLCIVSTQGTILPIKRLTHR